MGKRGDTWFSDGLLLERLDHNPGRKDRPMIVSCETCGAAILLDPREEREGIDRSQIHADWHQSLSR